MSKSISTSEYEIYFLKKGLIQWHFLCNIFFFNKIASVLMGSILGMPFIYKYDIKIVQNYN